MYQLSFDSYCPPGAFCEQTIVRNPPTNLHDYEDWSLLARAEVRRARVGGGGVFCTLGGADRESFMVPGRCIGVSQIC